MAILHRDTPWCRLALDTTLGRLTLEQRWLYVWTIRPPAAPWTRAGKQQFHARAESNIRLAWSSHAFLHVVGVSPFAVRFQRGRGIPLSIDIRWVTARPHWNVTVTKVAPGVFAQSHGVWATRRISLDTNDFTRRRLCGASVPPACTNQTPVSHEFGHAFGNTSTLGRGDEYPAASAHHADNASIMHSGSLLRDRHFQTVIGELNLMMPGTTFSVGHLR